MSTIDLTEASFEQAVNADGITLIDWWAEWCGPCRQFAPIYEEAAERHSDVTFAKIDTEAEQALAGALQISSIPTLMAFRDGILLYAEPGAVPGEALDQIIDQVKALDMDQVKRDVAAQEAEDAAKEA